MRFRSVSNIVIAPARTGRAKSRSIAVIVIAHANSGIRFIVIPFHRILIVVVIKFIALRIEDAPAKCNEKMVISTAGPA